MDQYFYDNTETNFDMSSTWRDFFESYDLKDHHEHGQNMQQVIKIVSSLKINDKRFKNYISSRIKRLKTL